MTARSWVLDRRVDRADLLHRPWPDEGHRRERRVAICRVAGGPGLVLGSTQLLPDGAVGALPPAFRRESGGGAVLVAPGAQVWMDLWLPRDDPLFEDDVVRAASWLGRAWAVALGALGIGPDRVALHEGPLQETAWSRTVCFAGLGPGEVTVDGRKLLGLAQRRTSSGARFHTMAPLRWEPIPLVSALERAGLLPAGALPGVVADVADRATGLRAVLGLGSLPGDDDLIAAVEEALLESLPEYAPRSP